MKSKFKSPFQETIEDLHKKIQKSTCSIEKEYYRKTRRGYQEMEKEAFLIWCGREELLRSHKERMEEIYEIG